MKKLFFLLLLVGCSNINTNNVDNSKNFKFSYNLTFKEYKSLLIEYSKFKDYPDIN